MSACGRCHQTYLGHLLACRRREVAPHVFRGYVHPEEIEEAERALRHLLTGSEATP